ncbi:MAG: hypothetical protein Q8Q37_00800 [bacterium]|nr:hypothetical protein [bacterium]
MISIAGGLIALDGFFSDVTTDIGEAVVVGAFVGTAIPGFHTLTNASVGHADPLADFGLGVHNRPPYKKC